MIIKGYKAFDKNMNNRYGQQFEEGKEYSVSGEVVFGNAGNGFHFCERLEDTLRYVNAMDEEVVIAEVVGSGEIKEAYDDYNGYYDMYVASNLKVLRVLDREEIIRRYLEVPSYRVERFVKGYRLSGEEILSFKVKYMNDLSVLQAIAYYQEDDKDAYTVEKAYQYMKLRRGS